LRNIGTKPAVEGFTGGSFSDVPRRLDPLYRWILFGCSNQRELHLLRIRDGVHTVDWTPRRQR
jgi:hypothetical protein